MATQSLFETEAVDVAALADLAARSIPLDEMKARGFRSMCKSSDLFEHGYTIIHWLHVADRIELIEYRPIRGGDLLRVTIMTYADQCRFHEAIGARVVSTGRDFKRSK